MAYRRQHPGAEGDIPDFLRSEFASGTWERTGIYIYTSYVVYRVYRSSDYSPLVMPLVEIALALFSSKMPFMTRDVTRLYRTVVPTTE